MADACAALGIPEPTVKTWLRRGRREPETAYGEFAQAVDAVRAAIAESPPGTYEELRAAVHEAARAGSVRAMRLWWRMLRDERRRG